MVIAAALTQFGASGDTPPDRTDVLLLDEPTASLDLAYQLEIRSILLDLNKRRGLTIVVSTHDLNMAASLCRDLILLDRGRVLAAGPIDSMMSPSLIRQLYDVDVDITTHPRTGHLTVVPVPIPVGALLGALAGVLVAWMLVHAPHPPQRQHARRR